VAPLLDRAELPRVFAKLLAVCACEIAEKVPLTAKLAETIRGDPLEVYRLLRDELLSRTHVERLLGDAVAAIAPRGSEELRATLAALAWPDKQGAALRWLQGRAPETAERELLGVTRDLDADADATAVLMAIAGAVARGGGVFALMVDEFEHLTAEDQRTNTNRNATMVKRLLEGLAGMGALVLVAGHWRAWDQQRADFKDRFAGQPAIDLVTLTGKETGQLARQYQPNWGARLGESALEAIAEAGGRNIRRVLAVLYQLYADTAAGNGPIGAAAVEAAASTRRRLVTETGRAEAVIEEAVRAAGGRVTREEVLVGRLRFDLVARRGEEVRLAVDIRYAATSLELRRLLYDYAVAMSSVQARHPFARGLLVATGAVDPDAFLPLDDIPGVQALPGEGRDWEAKLRSAATEAVESSSVPAMPPVDETAIVREEAARETLREARVTHEAAAAATRSRLEAIDFGSDERGVATAALVRGSAPAVPMSAYGPDASVLDDFSESMKIQNPTFMSFLGSPTGFISLTLLLMSVGALLILGPSDLIRTVGANSVVGPMFIPVLVLLPIVLVVLIPQRYHVEKRAFRRYQRWGRQKLEEMLVSGAPGEELLRVKNRLIDAPDASGGIRSAFEYASEVLPPQFRDDLSPGRHSLTEKA
jgi:hypothetical protein